MYNIYSFQREKEREFYLFRLIYLFYFVLKCRQITSARYNRIFFRTNEQKSAFYISQKWFTFRQSEILFSRHGNRIRRKRNFDISGLICVLRECCVKIDSHQRRKYTDDGNKRRHCKSNSAFPYACPSLIIINAAFRASLSRYHVTD